MGDSVIGDRQVGENKRSRDATRGGGEKYERPRLLSRRGVSITVRSENAVARTKRAGCKA